MSFPGHDQQQSPPIGPGIHSTPPGHNVPGPHPTHHNVPGAHPPGHNVRGAHPTHHNVPEAHPPGHNVPGAHPTGHNVPGAHPPGHSVPGAHPTHHNVPGAHPPGHNVPGAHPTGHNVPGAQPTGHNVPGAQPTGHNVPGVHPTGHNVPGAHPTGHNVPGAQPTGHNVPGAHPTGQNVPGAHPTPTGHNVPGVQPPPIRHMVPWHPPPPSMPTNHGVPGHPTHPRPVLAQGLPTEGPPGVTPVSTQQPQLGTGQPAATGQFPGFPGYPVQMPVPMGPGQSVLPGYGQGAASNPQPMTQPMPGIDPSAMYMYQQQAMGMGSGYPMPGTPEFQQLSPEQQKAMFQHMQYQQMLMQSQFMYFMQQQQQLQQFTMTQPQPQSLPQAPMAGELESTKVEPEKVHVSVKHCGDKDIEAEIAQASTKTVSLSLTEHAEGGSVSPEADNSPNEDLESENALQSFVVLGEDGSMIEDSKQGLEDTAGLRHLDQSPLETTQAVAIDTTELDRVVTMTSGSGQESGEPLSRVPEVGPQQSFAPTTDTKDDKIVTTTNPQQEIGDGDTKEMETATYRSIPHAEAAAAQKQALPDPSSTCDTGLDDVKESVPSTKHSDVASPSAASEKSTKPKLNMEEQTQQASFDGDTLPTKQRSPDDRPPNADTISTAENSSERDGETQTSDLAEEQDSVKSVPVGNVDDKIAPGSSLGGVMDPLTAETREPEALTKETLPSAEAQEVAKSIQEKAKQDEGSSASPPSEASGEGDPVDPVIGRTRPRRDSYAQAMEEGHGEQDQGTEASGVRTQRIPVCGTSVYRYLQGNVYSNIASINPFLFICV